MEKNPKIRISSTVWKCSKKVHRWFHRCFLSSMLKWIKMLLWDIPTVLRQFLKTWKFLGNFTVQIFTSKKFYNIKHEIQSLQFIDRRHSLQMYLLRAVLPAQEGDSLTSDPEDRVWIPEVARLFPLTTLVSRIWLNATGALELKYLWSEFSGKFSL